MWNTFKYTALYLLKNPGVLIWSLLFPIVLSTVFMMMFSPLDDVAQMEAIRVVAVEPDDTPDGQAFSAFVEAISEGDDGLFDVTYARTAEEAAKLVADSATDETPFTGYIMLDGTTPAAFVTGNLSVTGLEGLRSSVLSMVMDEYAAKSHLAEQLVATDPGALANPAVAQSLFETVDATQQISVTDGQPKESTRFYYALLGMAALFGGSLALMACQRLRPNVSALGARRSVAATSHAAAVAGTLLAAWALSFACLAIAYLYMKFVGRVDFGDHDAACLLTVAAASLMATALGCAISSIPKVPEDGKNGILTGIVCFASLFAGLYGQPTMKLADMVSANFPVADYVNPAAQISQAFYSIMYYDTPAPLMEHLAILAAMAVVLFLVSASTLRRQRYASI